VSRPPPTGAAALAGFDFDDVEQLGSKRGALRPLFIGKVNTALQMALITFAASEPVFAAHAASPMMGSAFELVADRRVRAALEYATAASAVVATAEYARIFLAHPGFDAHGRLKARRE
jgi:cardiolipin synthase